MKSLRKLLFTFLPMVLAALALSSCDQENIFPTRNPSNHIVQAQAGEIGFFELENGLEQEEDLEEDECFEINYPVTISFPDGTTQVVNTDEEVDLAIETWETNNPDSEDWPTFIFPIDVTLEDGSVLSLMDDEELCELYMECWGEEYAEEGFLEFIELLDEALYELEDIGFDELICYEVQYPINIVFPDGSVQAAQSEEDVYFVIDTWYEVNPDSEDWPELEFPIFVTLDDGTVDTMSTDEDLIELSVDCVIEVLGEDAFTELLDYLGEIDEWDEEDCFDINYPVDLVFPDNTTQTIQSEAELDVVIDDWIIANPDSEAWPEFVFPITVTFEDGSTASVASDEELCELYIQCEEYDDDYDDDDD